MTVYIFNLKLISLMKKNLLLLVAVLLAYTNFATAQCDITGTPVVGVDEAVVGDLPDNESDFGDPAVPSQFTVTDPVMTATGDVQDGVDVVAFTVPTGTTVDCIVLSDYVNNGINTSSAFLTFTVTGTTAMQDGMTAFLGMADIGKDVLAETGAGALPAGDYNIQIFEVSGESTPWELTLGATIAGGGGPIAPSITLVPTMTEWGLFLFGLVMVTMGLVFVYNKQRQLA